MAPYTPPKMVIKSWAEEDRPREKMLRQGRTALTDAELLAILIGSGNTESTAVDLAKNILASVDNNLHKLSECTLQQLMKFKGIGEAKAIAIAASAELGRRRAAHTLPERPRITSSQDCFKILYPLLGDLQIEMFYVLYLNRSGRLIDKACISQGGVSATLVDSRPIFSKALEVMASSIILSHNHPSGNLEPSDQDISLTRKLSSAAKLLDMSVLDHIIIAGNRYTSFGDEGISF